MQLDFRRYRNLLPVILGTVGIVLVLFATTRYGAGMTRDSAGYVSVTESLVNGDGFYRYDGSHLVVQPPLFPIGLALINTVSGIAITDVARVVNAVLWGVIIALSVTVLLRRFDGWIALWASLLVLLSRPMQAVSQMVWTETLFSVLVMGCLFALERFLRDSRRSRWLLITTLCAAGAMLTRYVGVILLPVGALGIMAFESGTIRRKLKDTVFFGAAAAVPLALWLLRNWLAADTLVGSRSPSDASLRTNLERTYTTMFSWFIPDRLIIYRWIIAAGIALVAAALLTAWIVYRRRTPQEAAPTWIHVRLTGFFFVGYVALIVISSTTTRYDAIDNRLLAPAYVPLVFLAAFGIEQILHMARSLHRQRIMIGIVALGMFAILLSPLSGVTDLVQDARAKGAGGYHIERYHHNDLIAYLDQHPPHESCPIYSNSAGLLYTLLHMRTQWTSELNAQGNAAPQTPAYLVWFWENRPYLPTRAELDEQFNLTPLVIFGDEGIYRLGKAAGEDATVTCP